MADLEEVLAERLAVIRGQRAPGTPRSRPGAAAAPQERLIRLLARYYRRCRARNACQARPTG